MIEPRYDRKSRRRLIGICLGVSTVLVTFALAGSRGRWTPIYDYDSGGMRSTRGVGTESTGGEGPLTLTGHEAQFTWELNSGVDRIQVAVIPAGTRGFGDWPESGVRAFELGGVEFGTPNRQGSWNFSLPPGEYWVNYTWSTVGGETGRWTFRVEERRPWWEGDDA
jgi:hypothetical protein